MRSSEEERFVEWLTKQWNANGKLYLPHVAPNTQAHCVVFLRNWTSLLLIMKINMMCFHTELLMNLTAFGTCS